MITNMKKYHFENPEDIQNTVMTAFTGFFLKMISSNVSSQQHFMQNTEAITP
jgi:hypothetical protein